MRPISACPDCFEHVAATHCRVREQSVTPSLSRSHVVPFISTWQRQGSVASQDDMVLRIVPDTVDPAQHVVVTAIIDGHNLEGSAQAAQIVRRILTTHRYDAAKLKDSLSAALRTADAALIADAAGFGISCIVAVLDVVGNRLALANIGDCQACIIRETAIRLITPVHRWNRPTEYARAITGASWLDQDVTPAETVCVRGDMKTSRALGSVKLREAGVISEPEIVLWTLDPFRDRLVLGSSGLWNYLDEGSVASLLDLPDFELASSAQGIAAQLIPLVTDAAEGRAARTARLKGAPVPADPFDRNLSMLVATFEYEH